MRKVILATLLITCSCAHRNLDEVQKQCSRYTNFTVRSEYAKTRMMDDEDPLSLFYYGDYMYLLGEQAACIDAKMGWGEN